MGSGDAFRRAYPHALDSYCSCGAKAIYPQRLIDGKPAHYDSPIIMAGDFYEPGCGEHFVLPGRPH